jgi:tripartite-type tricarboxylate transporter receptor subunit TctC
VTTAKRAPSAPQTPTLAEAGFAGFDASSWFGLVAPANTHQDIVGQLNARTQKALQSSDVREKLTNIGAEVVGGTPEQFGAFIAAEYERWARLIKERNIKAN